MTTTKNGKESPGGVKREKACVRAPNWECCRCGKSAKSLKNCQSANGRIVAGYAKARHAADKRIDRTKPSICIPTTRRRFKREAHYTHTPYRCQHDVDYGSNRIITHRRHRNTPITEQLFYTAEYSHWPPYPSKCA